MGICLPLLPPCRLSGPALWNNSIHAVRMGSNIHLGGLDTLIGYYGGVGQPDHYALKWLDEFLYYYTTYGVRQILNVNSGTVLIAYMLYRLGIDIEFKISVTLGNDNPYAALWTLLTAALFARQDGSTPLKGFKLEQFGSRGHD